MLEARIKTLSRMFKSISVDEIEKAYKEEEVGHLESHLKKFPEVRYSDKLLKKMFREARAKRISPGRKKYLANLLEWNNDFKNSDYINDVLIDSNAFVKRLIEKIKHPEKIRLLHIEHDHAADDFYCQVYGNSKKHKFDNEVCAFAVNFDFTELWNFLKDKKYLELCEVLSYVDFDNEEYMIAFEELNKCRSYKLVQMALNRKVNRERISNQLGFKNMTIEIGEHDNWCYDIFKC